MTTVKTIDLTPTWASLMPLFFTWLENGSPAQKELAKEEILKLARAVDQLAGKRVRVKA